MTRCVLLEPLIVQRLSLERTADPRRDAIDLVLGLRRGVVGVRVALGRSRSTLVLLLLLQRAALFELPFARDLRHRLSFLGRTHSAVLSWGWFHGTAKGGRSGNSRRYRLTML